MKINLYFFEGFQFISKCVLSIVALWEIGSLIHRARDKWGITSSCPCGGNKTGKSGKAGKNGVKSITQGTEQKTVNGTNEHMYESKTDSGNPLSLLADVASYETKNNVSDDKNVLKEKFDGNDQKGESLRELLTKKAIGKLKNGDKAALLAQNVADGKISCMEDIMLQVAEKTITPKPCKQLVNFVPKHGMPTINESRPQQIHNVKKTQLLYPSIEHSWLDNGRLLRLVNPRNPENAQLFQQQWKRGKVSTTYM